MIRAFLLIACLVGIAIIGARMLLTKQASPTNSRKVSIRKPDKVRFKGQIVQDTTGRKGEILEVTYQGSSVRKSQCLMGTPKAQVCTLIILWDKTTSHDYLPASTTFISSVVDTHNPLYPVLNYLEWAEFRANQAKARS